VLARTLRDPGDIFARAEVDARSDSARSSVRGGDAGGERE
jgi:hypothetical protein